MKKQLLALLILPMQAFAQPIITNAENYTIGSTIKSLYCNPAAAGTSGMNQTWNFGNLAPFGDTLIQWIEAPPSTLNPFPGADLVIHANDTTFTYYDTSSTEINMMGLVDSSISNNGMMSYSNNMLVITRPITYLNTASDSFYNAGSFGGYTFTGSGGTMLLADGYGTLQLPNDTFTNVLRVKTLTQEQDIVIGFGVVNTSIASYTWYNNSTSAPLLRIDSIMFTGAITDSSVDVQYYYIPHPTDVKEVGQNRKIDATASLVNNELLVSANFENGRNYELSLYGINGQKVYNSTFAGNGTQQHFNIDADLSSGTYILTLRNQGNMGSQVVIKVVR